MRRRQLSARFAVIALILVSACSGGPMAGVDSRTSDLTRPEVLPPSQAAALADSIISRSELDLAAESLIGCMIDLGYYADAEYSSSAESFSYFVGPVDPRSADALSESDRAKIERAWSRNGEAEADKHFDACYDEHMRWVALAWEQQNIGDYTPGQFFALHECIELFGTDPIRQIGVYDLEGALEAFEAEHKTGTVDDRGVQCARDALAQGG